MIFGKNARTNNDMIQSKYVISYVGEYVIKKQSGRTNTPHYDMYIYS